MIVGFEKTDIAHWRNDLKAYESRKKTLFPQREHSKQVLPTRERKQQNRQVESTLQKYASSHLSIRPKEDPNELDRSLKKYMSKPFNYQKSYDIITLHPTGQFSAEQLPSISKKAEAPIRNIYNIINGQKLTQEYLKNRKYPKKELNRSRDFNIINLEYKQDNIARQKEDASQLEQQITQKCMMNHVYDNIYHRFYNPEEQERYWKQKKEENIKKASQDFDMKLPPTYQTRERFIQDYTKPLPEPMKHSDQRKEERMRGHQAKYLFEERYKIKNIEDADRKEVRMLNRFNRGNSGNLNKTAMANTHQTSPKIKSFGFD